jgi:serine/threonine-protein kinase
MQLLLDQRRRWQQGDRVRVEDYLARYAPLANDDEALLDLICNEIDLREQGEDPPRLGEYVGRFPALADQLKVQFEVHAAITPELNQDVSTLDGHLHLERDLFRSEENDTGAVLQTPVRNPKIPGYEVLVELGRGAMGVVYQARQVGLDRVVALKLLGGGALASRDEASRFQAEAQAVARLQHPNIVQVHEVGEHEGQAFFSLEYVGGGTLARRLRQGRLPLEEAVRLMVTLTRAVDYAHQQGIIHRDLKPSNVLLAEDGSPRITDFGLAKQLYRPHAAGRPWESLTVTGAILGTPSYMAPEQAAGNPRTIGPATDIHALGAILYELLTGRPPFEGTDLLTMLDRVRTEPPAPPSVWRPDLPRDLEAICMKCLEKEPRRRYASAGDLADDLVHFLRGETVSARSANMLERLARTLEHRQYTIEFRVWKHNCLFNTVVILLATPVFFLLTRPELACPPGWFFAALLAELSLMSLSIWYFRQRLPRPLTTDEHRFCSIMRGHCLTDLMIFGISLLLAGGHQLNVLTLYPMWALTAGLVWWILGSWWGRAYVFAVAFFLLAFLMPLHLSWAPLYFGALWVVAELAVAWQLGQAEKHA